MPSNYKVNGTDIDTNLIPRSYLLDRYPELSAFFKNSMLSMTGSDSSGTLGNNTATGGKFSSPVIIASGSVDWKLISAGLSSIAGIKTDGTLWTWGGNSLGQLGTNTTTARSSPGQTVSATTNWKMVSMKGSTTCGIKTDGTLWLWGYNNYGQLGDNTITSKSSPVQTVSATTNWKFVTNSPYDVVTAIKTDGTLWTWGDGTYGQMGNNSTLSRSSPIQVAGTTWSYVTLFTHTLATKTDGTLWAWGRNNAGQLGLNDITNRSSPVQVGTDTTWKKISAGISISAGIKTDGTLWMWGTNSYGQLGTNNVTRYSSPVQTVSGGTNWYSINIEGYSSTLVTISAAIKTDGSLWVWGMNTDGELGDGTRTNRSSPVQTIAGGYNWKQIVGGVGNMYGLRDMSDDPI